MITANVAYEQTTALMEEDAKALEERIDHYLDNNVEWQINDAIEHRKMYCGISIPAALTNYTDKIAEKIQKYGFTTMTTYGVRNYICIRWEHAKETEKK